MGLLITFDLVSRSSMISTRSLLESTDRNRRAAEQDLSDTNEELAEATNVNQALTAAQRKLEAELNQMNVSAVFACLDDDKDFPPRPTWTRCPASRGCLRRRPSAPWSTLLVSPTS